MSVATEVRATVNQNAGTTHFGIPQVYIGRDGKHRYMNGDLANNLNTDQILFLPKGTSPSSETLKLVVAKRVHPDGASFYTQKDAN